MSDKYKNKYRIQSARLQHWDYGQNGNYFVTICTKNRENFFGEINNGTMQLSPIGKLAEKYWKEIPQHFPFVILDAFVVMPNHVHGIITIAKNGDTDGGADGDTDRGADRGVVETQNIASLPSPTHLPSSSSSSLSSPSPSPTHPQSSSLSLSSPSPTHPPSLSSLSLPQPPQPSPENKFGPQSQNLASIIRGYKIGVTKNAKLINPLWKWQPRFHDHIIRNNQSLHKIRAYIINNPLNWQEDTFYEY